MNAYVARRRRAPILWTLIVMLLLPPGWMPMAAAANRRTNTLSRDATLETFRNPQFSSARDNRFLSTMSPTALVGEGGDSFSSPDLAGYGSTAEPDTHWLTYKGRLEWSDTDLSLDGVGLPLFFQRMYRGSLSDYEGPLGDEWEFNWNKRFLEEGDSDAVFYEMGRVETYDESSGTYTSPAGRYDTLTKSGGELTRTDKYGVKEIYEADTTANFYRLETITDLNSNRLTFKYNGSGHLTKVTDSLDQDTVLSYDGNDRITKIADRIDREWLYTYDGSGRLITVRTPIVNLEGDDYDFLSGKSTTYLYDSSNRLTEIKRPEDSSTGTWKWEYDGSGRITKQIKGGNNITLAYDEANKRVTVTDREAVQTRYEYNGSDLITKRRLFYDASNAWETTWAYDASDEVTSAIFPLGNRVEYVFDGSGNVLTVKFKKDADDASPVQWVYTYASNARLSTLKDPNLRTWDLDYDGSGNLLTRTAPTVTVPGGVDGTIRWIYAVNGSGLVTRTVDSVGTTHDSAYNTVNSKPAFLTRVIDDVGGLTLTTVHGRSTIGRLTSTAPPEGNTTTYLVNELDQVVEAYEPGSVTRKTFYDGNNRVTKTAVSNDSTVGNSWFEVNHLYDQVDNLTATYEDLTDATRITTTYAFDKNDRLTKVTSPVGNETVFSYDQRDLRTAVTRKAASSPDDAITTTIYDANGNLVTITNPRGYNTISALDLYDRVTKVTRPEGGYRTMAYDKAGNLTLEGAYNGGNTKLAETTSRFDEANRLYETEKWAKKADLSTSLGDGLQTVTILRDEMGRILEHEGDACGCSLWTNVYDAVGRLITKTDPLTNYVLHAYDKNGRLTIQTRHDDSQDTGIEADKDVVTEFVYDARNRMTLRKDKLATSTYCETTFYFGKRDQVTKVVDGGGFETRTEHNEQLWTTKDIAENGSPDVVTEYTYDSDGRVVTYRAKNTNTGDQDTLYTYDKLDRVVTTTWPDSELLIQTYDKASNKISTTQPIGTLVIAAYDKNNRLTSRTMSLGTNVIGQTSMAFGFDGMDRMTAADASEADFDSSITWTYNSLSKKETEKQVIDGYASGAGRTFTYTWDVEGQKTAVTYPVSGWIVGYTRDGLDRADVVSRSSTQLIDYTFSGQRVLKKAYPGSYALMTYDGYGRLTKIHHKDTGSGNTLAQFDYGYDRAHQVTSLDKLFYDDVQNTRITSTVKDKGDQYGYDGAKRLVTVLRGVPTAYIGDTIASNISNNRYDDKVEYILDQTGNRLTRKIDGSNDVTYAYNAVNEMTTEGASSHTYDDNGNFEGTSNQYKYHWNDQVADGDLGGDDEYIYHYDALGRMIQRDHIATARSVRWYFDGIDAVEQNLWQSSAEAARKFFVFGENGYDELLEYVDILANPDLYYYNHADRLGSVMVLADESGNIDESYRYREFGETTIVSSSFVKLTTDTAPSGNPHRFTARRADIQLGSYGDDFYDYRARVLRTEPGRFVQRVPARSGIQPLSYGWDEPGTITTEYPDPNNFCDPCPSGSCCDVCLSSRFVDDLSQSWASHWAAIQQSNCLSQPANDEKMFELVTDQLDCYDLPLPQVEECVAQFSDAIAALNASCLPSQLDTNIQAHWFMHEYCSFTCGELCNCCASGHPKNFPESGGPAGGTPDS